MAATSSKEAAPVWGGVYVGPASEITASTAASTASQPSHSRLRSPDEDTNADDGHGPAITTRLFRTLSGSKKRSSLRGGSAFCLLVARACALCCL